MSLSEQFVIVVLVGIVLYTFYPVGYRHGRADKNKPHSERFRKVSNRYPHRVAETYNDDLAAAAADTDDEVAAKVAAWERLHRLKVRDWPAIAR